MKRIWSNLQRGLKNYCAENGFDRVILGLSGGLDSAITAVLAADWRPSAIYTRQPFLNWQNGETRLTKPYRRKLLPAHRRLNSRKGKKMKTHCRPTLF